jgi:hypothetical protein
MIAIQKLPNLKHLILNDPSYAGFNPVMYCSNVYTLLSCYVLNVGQIDALKTTVQTRTIARTKLEEKMM